ncbi:hypothetical protein DPMN_026239 [Dreissena polymorpha]|uniref:Uncharacterized protein n=1 Tax=Dreissena polymorpha TaxID=45954 RepID=A0A9D4LSU7_DREPO|nr:hypothetical protein DPMN_026239 [Dreissena polymorpha]
MIRLKMKMTPSCGHESKVLTKFHEDWTKNVTSRVFTYFHYIHLEKTAPPPGGHVFSPIWTIFKLVRDINETNVLTKHTAPPPCGHIFQRTQLHEDWASNATSTVFTSFELSRGINGRSQKLTMSTAQCDKLTDRHTQTDRQTDRPSANHKSPPCFHPLPMW